MGAASNAATFTKDAVRCQHAEVAEYVGTDSNRPFVGGGLGSGWSSDSVKPPVTDLR